MPVHKCPYCKGRIKVEMFRAEGGSRSSGFQSTQTRPNLLWVLFGGRERFIPPPKPNLVVRTEQYTNGKLHRLNELELPIDIDEAAELAQLYCHPPGGLGFGWSRDATDDHTSIGQRKHNRLAKRFVALGFLKKLHRTKFRLTDAGQAFLWHYLPNSRGVYRPELDPLTNRQ